MNRLLLASAMAVTGSAALAAGHDGPVRIGVIMGFTGPIESLTPHMAGSAEMALAEINAAGGLPGGRMLEPVRGDSTCLDNAAATAAAERLITEDGVAAIVGADCSGVTGAVLANAAVPNGIPMISPSAVSPGLSEIDDRGLFFRTVASSGREGAVLAGILAEKGIGEVVVTYTNSDYGKGLADAFEAAFVAAGGTVTLNEAHEDGKAD